jgi:glycosyltransferase involved in cell wall biosynthesis
VSVKVLYSFPDGVGRPGIGTTALHQVRGVAGQDVDVLLYCTSLHAEVPQNVQVVRTLSLAGRRLPHRVLGIERTYRYHDVRVAAALRRLGSEVDVVHCWPRATIRTSGAAHRSGVPSLREVPNTHTAHAFDAVAREVERLGMQPVPGDSHTFDSTRLAREEEEYRRADALLVPSDYSRSTFLERGFPASKLLAHRYGYDPERFYPPQPGLRRDTPGSLRALFVGRCEPRKGLHHALRAWLDSGAGTSGRFTICGSFAPGYAEALGGLLQQPGVEVRGFVSDPAELMRESDVLLLPSLEEGSALVTYEAQACGCVNLVSDASGAPCRDGIEGLVHAAGDASALTEHIRRVLADRALLLRLREAGLEQAKGLTWAAAGEELAGIYAAHARIHGPN